MRPIAGPVVRPVASESLGGARAKRPGARLARARSRGVTSVPQIMEAAMVIGWFAVLVVGELAMNKAVDARRSAEDGADESATKTAANYCQPQGPTSSEAQTTPSVKPSGIPPAQAAISAVVGLGLGSERTFPNYLKPLQSVEVEGKKQESLRLGRPRKEEQFSFEGQRGSGCLEKPLDVPKGTVDEYRAHLWATKLQGY